MSKTLKLLIVLVVVMIGVFLLPSAIKRRGRNKSDSISQQIDESKTKTDNLRNAMRYLTRMTPLNRSQTSKEVQLELNTWIQNADRTSANYTAPKLLDALPADMLSFVGCSSPLELQFSDWDVDYLFERRMMSKLAGWIVDFPLRDSLVVQVLDKKKAELEEKDALKIEEACKLFDWVMRNVALEAELASVEEKTVNPNGIITENGFGYSYLPWESLLFSTGDFMEKGRVFTALAAQREIPTVWISDQGYIWAIGVLVGDELIVFEPKLGMPVLEPDKVEFASLADAQDNQRVLRRMDLPGQFDYAFNPGDLKKIELLIDLPPTAVSARMKMLEQQLLSDERMRLYHDINDLVASLSKVAPDASISLWEVPLKAQIHAAMVREKLSTISEFTSGYMTKHGVWMMNNPAANGRLNHLAGMFENSKEKQGALSLYMDCRYDEETLRQLQYDPAVQKGMGMPRMSGEDQEKYKMRLAQADFVFRKAKVDASFLMAQLHYDRGDFDAAANWFLKRVINNDNPLAAQWNAIGRYGLARVYQEQGELEKATEQLTFQPSPIEAGNRLRLRYLRNMLK